MGIGDEEVYILSLSQHYNLYNISRVSETKMENLDKINLIISVFCAIRGVFDNIKEFNGWMGGEMNIFTIMTYVSWIRISSLD